MKIYLINTKKKIKVLSFFAIYTFSSTLSTNINASPNNESKQLLRENISFTITNPANALSVMTCINDICSATIPSKDMLNAINNGYSEITTKDITQDGTPEIILTHSEEGNVNVCSKIYRYNRKGNYFSSSADLPKQLCNYTVKNNHVVSSYRSGGKWYEDIYKIKNNSLTLEITDSCIGCEYVNRAIYSPNGEVEHTLVTDNTDYTSRVPLSTTVISKKAILHQAPDIKTSNGMYLIKGDKVILTNFTASESGTYWYKIRYITKKGKPINAWLQCGDIKYCAQ